MKSLKLKAVIVASALVAHVLVGQFTLTSTAFAGGSKAAASASKISPQVIEPGILPDFEGTNRYLIDKGTSQITFTVYPPIGKIRGKVKAIDGFYVMDPTDLANTDGQVKFIVNDMTTNAKYRDKMMKNEVLEADKYPVIAFKITEIAHLSPTDIYMNEFTSRVTGQLTLHGIKRKVSFPVVAERKNDGFYEFYGTFEIDLKDYDIKKPYVMFMTIDDEIDISFKISAKPAADVGPIDKKAASAR